MDMVTRIIISINDNTTFQSISAYCNLLLIIAYDIYQCNNKNYSLVMKIDFCVTKSK